MLLLVFRKVYICNIMSHTNIMQAEENDLVNILSLQKKSFMVVAERMNKFDRFFVKFGGNLFFISTVFFFLNPIKSCRYVCFLVTLKTPHH